MGKGRNVTGKTTIGTLRNALPKKSKKPKGPCKDCGAPPVAGFMLCASCARQRGHKICSKCGSIFALNKKQPRLRMCYDCRFKARVRHSKMVSGGLPSLGKRRS